MPCGLPIDRVNMCELGPKIFISRFSWFCGLRNSPLDLEHIFCRLSCQLCCKTPLVLKALDILVANFAMESSGLKHLQICISYIQVMFSFGDSFDLGAHQRGMKQHFFKGFLEGSLKEVLLRRVLRRRLVRVLQGQGFLEGFLEGWGL